MPAEQAVDNSDLVTLGLESNSQRFTLEARLARLRIRRTSVDIAITSLRHYLKTTEGTLAEGAAAEQPTAVCRSTRRR